jgi:murein DD-endopeptidase MepM/ murein hydrolase activator NlpD
MAKGKYFFNPESLNYHKVKPTYLSRVLKLLAYLSASFAVAMFFYVVFDFFFDTPLERGYIQDNKQLEQNLEVLSKKRDDVKVVIKDLQNIDTNIYRLLFGNDPLSQPFSYNQNMEALMDKDFNELAEDLFTGTDSCMVRIKKQKRASVLLDKMIKQAGDSLFNIPSIQPVENPDLSRTAAGWGYKMNPMYNKIRRFHNGMDFTAPSGTEVFATADGVVEDADNSAGSEGVKIVINHLNGYKTVYSHLDNFTVRIGQTIKRQDVIGHVGNSGLSAAPHLHYEIHYMGQRLNPVNYYFCDLKPKMYNKLIELSLRTGQSFD